MSPRAAQRLLPGLLVSGFLLTALIAGYGYIVLAEPGRSGRAVTLVDQSQSVTSPTASATGSATGSAVRQPSAPATDANSKPVRVSIPSIGVDSSLQSLGLLKDGSLQPPTRYEQAGWYAKGVIPGSVGPAVIAGHVDSVAGPAVFFRLRDLRVGDLITVQRQNGSILHFVVDDIHAYDKAHFPSATVYGPTAVPELRLVTCTGDFDRQARSYLQNLVVSAHLG